ncbi:hypothetical protein ACFQBQ_10630 [Granulicella cerasi]|uniref:Uncharacterized protein n=1 Tax=Granulicella cerasi TaxID=741063 RepID=A0ABW1ZCV8_9BACT|nr:hypothetical protein [Granulicella cerasi]
MRKVLLATTLLLVGCHTMPYTPPEKPMPPNTILLSQMMRELTAEHPQLVEQLVAQINDTGKKGPAYLTPKLADELRKRILGRDWGGLDRFPGWTMSEVNPTVRVVSHFAGKSDKLEGLSAAHPGSPTPALSDEQTRNFIDLGPYMLERGHHVSLDEPSTLPPFSTQGLVSELGAGVTRGDGANDLAPEHAESQRLADVMNRLALNDYDNARSFSASVEEHSATTPQQLITALQQSGHTVTVIDARYFANFGHFHFRGQDVMMPFWINTQIAVPHTGSLLHRDRPLLIPVSHAEYEWQIRGPKINADISYYFGIDGKSEWRTMDTLDQPWVLKRAAHTYTGEQAVEVTRLAGLITVAFMRQHAKRPTLPFGGYYALGVCQDGVSAIERKMTGKVTLFPNTADASLFDDPRDAEVNAMMAAIPKDRAGALPEPERIFGSLPTDDFAKITIPGLADDLRATHDAWQAGTLRRTHGWLYYAAIYAGAAVLAGAALALAYRRRSQ